MKFFEFLKIFYVLFQIIKCHWQMIEDQRLLITPLIKITMIHIWRSKRPLTLTMNLLLNFSLNHVCIALSVWSRTILLKIVFFVLSIPYNLRARNLFWASLNSCADLKNLQSSMVQKLNLQRYGKKLRFSDHSEAFLFQYKTAI